MRRGFLPPCTALAVLLALSLWNARAITARATLWTAQLDAAEAAVRAEDWDAASDLLTESMEDWLEFRTWLHVVALHSAVDSAEDLYRRCLLYAEDRERGDLLASLSDLRDLFHLLAESEHCTLGNIL